MWKSCAKLHFLVFAGGLLLCGGCEKSSPEKSLNIAKPKTVLANQDREWDVTKPDGLGTVISAEVQPLDIPAPEITQANQGRNWNLYQSQKVETEKKMERPRQYPGFFLAFGPRYMPYKRNFPLDAVIFMDRKGDLQESDTLYVLGRKGEIVEAKLTHILYADKEGPPYLRVPDNFKGVAILRWQGDKKPANSVGPLTALKVPTLNPDAVGGMTAYDVSQSAGPNNEVRARVTAEWKLPFGRGTCIYESSTLRCPDGTLHNAPWMLSVTDINNDGRYEIVTEDSESYEGYNLSLWTPRGSPELIRLLFSRGGH